MNYFFLGLYFAATEGQMERQRMLDFDDMLEELGELGKFQIYIYILVCLPVLFGAANSLSYVFTAGVPDYRYPHYFYVYSYYRIHNK